MTVDMTLAMTVDVDVLSNIGLSVDMNENIKKYMTVDITGNIN